LPAHLGTNGASLPTVKLLDGRSMPSFGLGVYMVKPGDETYNSVKWALELGYRMVDTAQVYGNEADVGRAIRDSGIPREELFVQSKLAPGGHGYDLAKKSVRESVEKMGIGYLDSMLIHTPGGGKLVETWDAFLELKEEGLLRSIGVSNFDIRHILALVEHRRPLPVVNQIEMHPLILSERSELVDYCEKQGIVIQAYGSIFFGQQDKLSDPLLIAVVAKHPGKTAAQVLLRWAVQKGFHIIPKSVKRHRIEENKAVFDFALSEGDMATLDEMKGELNAYWNPVNDAPVDIGETHHWSPKAADEL